MAATTFTDEINDAGCHPEDGTQSRKVDFSKSEPTGKLKEVDDTHLTSEPPEFTTPPCTSPGPVSPADTCQPVLEPAGSILVDTATHDAPGHALGTVSNQSGPGTITPETPTVVEAPSIKADLSKDATIASDHRNSTAQATTGQGMNEESAESSEYVQFPPYYYCPSGDTENIYEYFPGGLHPVHIGDILDDRFEVVHKLGQGGFATIWLCLETQIHKWRAVKIIKAEESYEGAPEAELTSYIKTLKGCDREAWEANHISLPLEHFWLEGPNGRHLCEVLQVHGPSIEGKWHYRVLDDGLVTLRDLLLQTATALKFLHDRDICHGDLTPRNILVRLQDISHIGKKEMIEKLGEPELETVGAAGGVDVTPMAPRYKVPPADIRLLGIVNEIVVTDFGESFRPSGEVPKSRGIPLRYAAPEAAFLCDPGLPSDIWSLACVILKVIANIGLVEETRSKCRYVEELEVALGALPEPYRTAHLDRIKQAIEEIGENWRDYVGSERKGKLKAYIPEGREEDMETCSLQIVSDPKVYELHKEGPDLVAQRHGWTENARILFMLTLPIRLGRFSLGPNDEVTIAPKFELMTIDPLPAEEIRLLSDLLGKMIKYFPGERIGIDEVLNHEWFNRSRMIDDGEVTIPPGEEQIISDQSQRDNTTKFEEAKDFSKLAPSPTETTRSSVDTLVPSGGASSSPGTSIPQTVCIGYESSISTPEVSPADSVFSHTDTISSEEPEPCEVTPPPSQPTAQSPPLTEQLGPKTGERVPQDNAADETNGSE
ncbi:kinase-like domain-containing protein [Hypoxylon fuscum]|nr:kinase-like domain-containing protein [Hypoxylon fuscum]